MDVRNGIPRMRGILCLSVAAEYACRFDKTLGVHPVRIGTEAISLAHSLKIALAFSDCLNGTTDLL
jgi:hypothetical protein